MIVHVYYVQLNCGVMVGMQVITVQISVTFKVIAVTVAESSQSWGEVFKSLTDWGKKEIITLFSFPCMHMMKCFAVASSVGKDKDLNSVVYHTVYTACLSARL